MNLGIKDAFEKYNPIFSKMANEKVMDRKVYLSDVLLRADIEFTEKGVKAAFTIMVIMTVALMPQ